ncbi:MAG: FtsQ-type POTRA domain-containing protein [Candidatus Andersenbacteria bacterium]
MQLRSRIFGRFSWPAIRQRLIEWGSIALLVSLVVVPVGILAWLVLFTSTFHVRAVTVVDARDHTVVAIEALTEQLLGRNILFLQTPVLEQRILSTLPQVQDVYITHKLPDTIRVVVQEKEPTFLMLSNATYFFVDDGGLAYEEARLETLPGIILPVIKNNDSGASLQTGQPAVEESFVSFILQAQEEVPKITEAEIVEMRVPSLSAREVHVLLDNNWLIRFDTTRPLTTQLTVLDRLLDHTLSEEDRQRIDYVDLRISNRVYYKLHTGAVAAPTAERSDEQ